MGDLGAVKFLEPSEEIPLKGQLIDESIIGVSVIENDLFVAPIYIQRAPKTDFILVKNKAKNGFQLRKIEYIYVVG